MDPYVFIIAGALAVIISHMFNLLAKQTNIPSVLMLIGLGLVLHQVLRYFGGFMPGPLMGQALNVLGIAGLIMIVLEAALDLELTRDRKALIARSFAVALLTLGGTTVAIAYVIHALVVPDVFRALVYATPLAIVSSAIVLPSVSLLRQDLREFMVYEATFSDILGIMLFYFLVDEHGDSTAMDIAWNVVGSVLLTVFVSLLVGFALIWVFQRIKTRIKFFLLIAVLMLLYAIGKKLNLSSLLIILVFGLMVSNHGLVFRGWLKRMIKGHVMETLESELHLITGETSFVVRTFFFLVFGLSIDIMRLADPEVLMIGAIVVVTIYAVRSIFVGLFRRSGVRTISMVAPRGLITILLAYNIPEQLRIPDRDGSILLVVILVTSVIMMFGLMLDQKEGDPSKALPQNLGGAGTEAPASGE
ncbi:MAG: cation:proton antiporter [Flavobacteriales bacterium]|nr:cation:proton antiporter [Flavobacteriales bacterium]